MAGISIHGGEVGKVDRVLDQIHRMAVWDRFDMLDELASNVDHGSALSVARSALPCLTSRWRALTARPRAGSSGPLSGVLEVLAPANGAVQRRAGRARAAGLRPGRVSRCGPRGTPSLSEQA